MAVFSRQSLKQSRLVQIFQKNIPLVAFIAIFAAFGTVALTRSFADTTTVSLLSNSGVPKEIDSDDAQAVELGLKFKSDVAGTVHGVRFYKSASNTGTHTGSLWSAAGTRLATVTFASESQSGWQEATFSSPVSITANTTYVVSYHTDAGHYSDSLGGFTSQLNNNPLHAVADGSNGPNGVYAYGKSVFPTNGWKAANYWVDVAFKPADATTTPPTTPPTTPTPPAATALSVDQQVIAHSNGGTAITSPALTTSSDNELVVAFITTDSASPAKGATVNSITGGGLTWTLRQRSNAQGGTTEIWQAVASKAISPSKVTATLSGSFAGSMVVTSFKGADITNKGAIGAANATSGAPKVSLTTTRNGSWVWGAGNDYDNATARTVGSSQVIVDQMLASVGDTYWVQRQAAATPAKGTVVTLDDTAPTTDRWNMAAIEILPAVATPTPPTIPTPPTPPAADTTAPSTPGSVTASGTSATQIDVSWKASTDNVAVAGYNIYRNGTKVTNVAGTKYSDTSLSPKTAYSYYVEAYDQAGNVSAVSATATASTLASPDQTAPSAPSSLSASAKSPTQVDLSWKTSTDNVGVSSYLVLRNNAVIATTTATTYSDTTAVANTSYTYAIEAQDAAGNVSAASSNVSVKTPNPADTAAPNTPTGLLAVAVSENQVNLTWAPSTDNVAVAGYTIYRNGTKVGTSTTTSFGDGTVVANTSYSYAAEAYDGAGNISARSTAATVKTPATTVPTPPTSGGSAIGSRPNDGSSYWPDFSNTGYKNTPANAGGTGVPAYPGKLTDWQSGMSADKYMGITFPDNSVISYKHFVGKVGIFGKNLTFVGCLFEGTNPNDNLVQIYTPDKVKFLYSTFKPVSYAMPPGNDGTVTSSHTSPGTPFNQSWQLATTMDTAVATMDHNDVWGNAGLEIVTGYPGQPSVWTNNYIHDASDTANNVYHHDGIGPQSEGNGGPMTIDHNTIASLGNTNGLALQGNGVYDHISFTNNYVSGWGYALSIGVSNNATNITVTGNVFSAELNQLYGFLYGSIWGGTARGSTWRNNLIQARSGDDNKAFTTTDNATYYWPTDNKGHATDYTN
jgi:chitodextrinase